MAEILNGKITGTKLGMDNGQLTAWLMVEGEGWGCGFGGYVLDTWYGEPGNYVNVDGYGAIIELMKALDVECWEVLNGQFVRVEIENQMITKIGHIIKEQWFSFTEYFEKVLRAQAVEEDCEEVQEVYEEMQEDIQEVQENNNDDDDTVENEEETIDEE